MGSTINLSIIAFCAVLLLAAIVYFYRQIQQSKVINLKLGWMLGIVFFLLGLGVQAMNVSAIYSNICCGPDTEEIAQKVKQALVYRYAYHFLAAASWIAWLVLRRLDKNEIH